MSCCCSPIGSTPAAPVAPLSNVFWIDQASAAGGDGSDETPYNSVTDAVAARASSPGSEVVFLICPADYSAEAPVTLTDSTVSFFAFQGQQRNAEDPPCVLPDIVCDDEAGGNLLHCVLFFRNLQVQVTSRHSSIESDGASIEMVEGAGSEFDYSSECWIRGTFQTQFEGAVDNLRAQGITIGEVTNGATTTTGAVDFSDCSFDSDVTSETITLRGCKFPGGVTLTADSLDTDNASIINAVKAGCTLTLGEIQAADGQVVNWGAATATTGQFLILGTRTNATSTGNEDQARFFTTRYGVAHRMMAYSSGSLTATLRKNSADTALAASPNNSIVTNDDDFVTFAPGDSVGVGITGAAGAQALVIIEFI